ncbi:MAG: hypothetical protein HUJ61_06390, partial [Bacilli bacterium]|nr:hypothetical protein [Bacilli bacterium]
MDQVKDKKKVRIGKKIRKGVRRTRRIILILVFVGVPLLLIATPIVAAYIFIYDKNYVETVKDPDFNTEEAIKAVGVDSIDNTKDTGIINLDITTHMIDQMIYGAYEDLTEQYPIAKEFIPSIGFSATDEEYSFFINVNIKDKFKTKLETVVTLDKKPVEIKDSETGTIETKDAFVFGLKDFRIGKVKNTFDFFQNKVLPKIEGAEDIISDETIEGLISNTGISLHSNIKDRQIYYAIEDLPKDMNKFLNNETSVYVAMLEEFYNDGLIDLKFNKEGLHGIVDVNYLNHTVSNTDFDFEDNSKANSVNFRTYLNKLSTLVETGAVTFTKDTEEILKDTFKYLIYG